MMTFEARASSLPTLATVTLAAVCAEVDFLRNSLLNIAREEEKNLIFIKVELFKLKKS